ncbi:MAG: prolyl oligopeptidase family serine peptidase [Acidobacteria bacterium]|nr:prolyl oligopeptidase family serine peptidase [Acidobacteriota bacterium]
MLKIIRCFVFSLIIVSLCGLATWAQDAGQVLGASVRYNTLKNSTSLTKELREAVEGLEKLAREANAAHRYGDALKHLTHAMTILRGQPWTPARALNAALTVKPERAIVEPDDLVRLRLGQIFSLDEKFTAKLSGTIELLPMTSNEALKILKTMDGLNADFATQATVIEVTVPEVPAGNYRLSLTFKYEGAAEPITKTATLHIERGLAARFAAAQARAAQLEARLRADKKETLLAVLPTAQYRLRLFDMASASAINFVRLNFNDELKEATALLDELEAKRDPLAARRGDFRKAYWSKVDNTLQPYRLFVPTNYDSTKAYPLIIALHGMGGDENSYFDLYLQGAFKVEAEKRGYIVACPKGREPASMYTGAAERDVLDVLEEVRRAYRIDAERIYMTGHSMGGFGTWSIAINHPDLFAALAPVAGGGNPAALAKIAHIPQLVVHGDNDKTVAVERSRVMVEAAKKVGAEVKYLEIPNGDHGSVAGRTFKDVYDFFDSHKRKTTDAKAAAAAQGH